MARRRRVTADTAAAVRRFELADGAATVTTPRIPDPERLGGPRISPDQAAAPQPYSWSRRFESKTCRGRQNLERAGTIAHAFGQPVDASRSVVAGATGVLTATVELSGAKHCRRVVWIQTIERQYLLIVGQMPLETPTSFAAIKESRLFLEVKECPELEAWVRDGKFDSVRLGLLMRVSQLGMLIGIENAPEFVEAEEAISLRSSLAVGLPLHGHGAFDQGLRRRGARLDLHFYDGAKSHAQSLEVVRLSTLPFTDDQDTTPWLSSRLAAPEIARPASSSHLPLPRRERRR